MEKQDEILQLEQVSLPRLVLSLKSYEVAFQMLRDIALLVQSQGEQIENISTNVSKTKDYIKKSEQILKQMKKKQKKTRKVREWVSLLYL